jgi:Ca2+-binding RTX toxin-like protein
MRVVRHPWGVAAMLASLCVLIPPSALGASTVSTDNATGKLVVTGDGGANAVTVAHGSSQVGGFFFSVTDTSGASTGDADCRSRNSQNVLCSATGLTAISVSLVGGNDSASLDTTVPSTASTLSGGGDNDTLAGDDGPDTLMGGAGADSMSGESGQDTASYDGGGSAVVDIGGGANDEGGDNVQSDIENLTGGAGNDRLTGDGDSNVLSGGQGSDVLIGGLGSDSLHGGGNLDFAGDVGDTASYRDRTASTAGVVADIGGGPNDGDPTLNSGAGEDDDIGTDIEHIEGGEGDDNLSGTGARNRLAGLGGNDTLHGLGGHDALEIVRNLTPFFPPDCVTSRNEGGLYGGPGSDDIYGGTGVDGLDGGEGNDSLYGGAHGEWSYTYPNNSSSCVDMEFSGLYGGPGDDILDGGAGDPGDGDLLSGGADTDTVTYADRAEPVVADIDEGFRNDGAPSANSGEGEFDSIKTDVENLIGGSAGDTLTGSAAANVLTGGDGGDTLEGGSGVDVAGARPSTAH